MFTRQVGLIAHLLDQRPQGRVMDAADDRIVLPELFIMQGPPRLANTGQIGDDDMEMGLRVQPTARVVLEDGIGQMAGADRLTLGVGFISAPLGEGLFYPAHRLSNRRHVGGQQPFITGHIGQNADRLGAREGEIDARPPPIGIADLLAIRQLALEDILEDLLFDLASEAHFGRAKAAPATDLAGVFTDVIVILREIGGGSTRRAHGCNRQHRLYFHVHALIIARLLIGLVGVITMAVGIAFRRIGKGLAGALLDGDLLLAP